MTVLRSLSHLLRQAVNSSRLLRQNISVPADEPKTPARRHLEEDEGRLDTRYKTSGPKLSDALDTTLRRPDPELKDDWNLDDLALPGNMGSPK